MSSTDNGPTSVYRLGDADGHLLYVGAARDFLARLYMHHHSLGSLQWVELIAFAQVEEFPTRDEALAVERATIRAESPEHNRHNNYRPHPEVTERDLENYMEMVRCGFLPMPEDPFPGF